jgi:hypothetical protein
LSSFVLPDSYRVKQLFMEVLVFKTTVENIEGVRKVGRELDSLVGSGFWNFALDDCDKVLRIVSNTVRPEMAIKVLNDRGFECCELLE